MMGINYKFDLLLSEDGSGRGAALVAAVLKRDENQTLSDKRLDILHSEINQSVSLDVKPVVVA